MLTTWKPTNNEQGNFAQFMREQTGMTTLRREERGELNYLHVLELNDKDIVQSELASEDSRSLGIQMRKFKETLDEEEQNELFMFTSLDRAVERFAEYLTFKYPGKRAAEWETKMANTQYRRDVEALFASRIYEHKYELALSGMNAFASPKVKLNVYQIYLQKRIREKAHEAVGRFGKIAKLNPELAQSPKWVYDVFTGIIKDLLLNDDLVYQLPDREAIEYGRGGSDA